MDHNLEWTVYRLYCEGYPTWEIARILDITEARVVRILGR